MKNDIVHIILPAMIFGMACGATSCTSDREPDTSELGEELEIEVMETASRSIVSTNDNLTKLPIMLYGDVYRTGEHSQGRNVIFDGEKVTYSDIDNKWTYKTPLYWLMSQEH